MIEPELQAWKVCASHIQLVPVVLTVL